MPVKQVSIKNQALQYTGAWNPGSIADGAQATTSVTISGVRLAKGWHALASFAQDIQAAPLTAHVSADDTVYVRLENLTGGALNLTNNTLTVTVFRASGS